MTNRDLLVLAATLSAMALLVLPSCGGGGADGGDSGSSSAWAIGYEIQTTSCITVVTALGVVERETGAWDTMEVDPAVFSDPSRPYHLVELPAAAGGYDLYYRLYDDFSGASDWFFAETVLPEHVHPYVADFIGAPPGYDGVIVELRTWVDGACLLE